MPSSEHIPLTELPQELRRRYGASVSYRTLWHLVVSGEIPAEKAGNRWRVAAENIPAVAKAVGIKLPVAA